ncbi:hypothetical protein OH146_11050 [Salinibacterium sp. SYSU T00001]|uniref:hypothetical protein n=1 Tax=Homoserinimonas sedimenticola TaxID=2986805 RepID=UPI002235C26C|nr:hypothetical protein [Salinibacterium sedimenticola]MCW4386309.1 hypothetical protein [Salinibacterium sedimenticola]
MLRPSALAPLAALALLLTGCSSAPEAPAAPSPEPSASSPFASEEEAVAAADALIKEYWAATNEVYQSGGEKLELLRPLVTDERMASEQVGVEIFQRGKFTQVGEYMTDGTRFQQMYNSGGLTHLIVTTCVDYSGVRAFNAAGQEAQRETPEPRFLHQVTLVAAPTAGDTKLQLVTSEPWPESPC